MCDWQSRPKAARKGKESVPKAAMRSLPGTPYVVMVTSGTFLSLVLVGMRAPALATAAGCALLVVMAWGLLPRRRDGEADARLGLLVEGGLVVSKGAWVEAEDAPGSTDRVSRDHGFLLTVVPGGEGGDLDPVVVGVDERTWSSLEVGDPFPPLRSPSRDDAGCAS